MDQREDQRMLAGRGQQLQQLRVIDRVVAEIAAELCLRLDAAALDGEGGTEHRFVGFIAVDQDHKFTGPQRRDQFVLIGVRLDARQRRGGGGTGLVEVLAVRAMRARPGPDRRCEDEQTCECSHGERGAPGPVQAEVASSWQQSK